MKLLEMLSDLHIWPSVNRCRICGKRVFVWQEMKMRECIIVLSNPLPVKISGYAIVHKECKGPPIVKIRVYEQIPREYVN